MARNTGAVYSGKLTLDKITGIRPDKVKKATPIRNLVRQDKSLPQVPKAMKSSLNEKNGAKY